MANVTRNISVVKSGYVHPSNPNSVYKTSASGIYDLGYDNGFGQLFFGIGDWPSSLKHNRLIDCSIRLYCRIGAASDWVTVQSVSGNFNINTLTFNNKPTDTAAFGTIDNTLGVASGSWGELSAPTDSNGSASSAYEKATRTRNILVKKGFKLLSPGLSYDSNHYMAKTVLANGSTAPYVHVTYSDSELVTSKVLLTGFLPEKVNAGSANAISWALYQADSTKHCLVESWIQTSAKVFWRIKNAATWNQINVSGATMSYTFPVGSLPQGNTIEYYVQSTDEDGTTTSTSVEEVEVSASQVSWTNCPSSVDARNSNTFAWKISSTAGAYTQRSAIFYWKKASDSVWNSINVSGSTTSLSVPANTFPSGASIQVKVTATDNTGRATTTITNTLSTLTSQIVADSYPSGNNLDVRAVMNFAWHLSNNFTQQSAKLYWKKTAETSWSQISISGNTKTLAVPAYTFPSGAEVQWYLSGTDTLGVTTITGTYSFTTASASVAPTGFPSGSNIDTRNAISFSWSITGTLGEYNQRSAKFYWKKSTESSWNSINISGSTKSVSVPANTFPTGSTIQWYVEATDASGTTTRSAQQTFNTVSTKITAQTYPSGNSVDFGSALTFTWVFKNNSGGSNYGQRSASLFWRAATTDPWTEIQASGTTQRITVPAYTFPSNATISWYLQGTDAGGTVSTTSTQSFKTVAPQITPQNSPTSGYADPRNAITFSWFFSTGSSNYPQESADFYWRVAGETEWNHVAASGSTQSVTIPANTFPLLSDIEWYLSGTDIGGTYSETQVYTFSTTASTAHAVCMDPVGKAVDGAKPVTLKWIVQNDDGSAATRTIVRWKLPSESQSQWHQLVDTTANITEYTVPEDTFPAGPIEWLVIAYNRDSVAGPASQASFVCIVAPDPPSGLTATAVPLTTISWQSTGQEAYEVSIDGETVAEGFGSDVYSYRVKEPLPDGAHTISVRIQGSYGLWSEASETQILVENVPKGSLTLTGEFGADADLYWEYTGEDDPETVAVYRDGKWIGTADGLTSARDRLVLGDHEYRVEYWFQDGNYTRSNTVSGTMDCSTPMIAEISGGPWIKLRLSENETRTQKFTRRRVSALSHITARAYPVLELSAYEDLTGGFDCAFRDRNEAKNFERLFGRTVILKSPGGMVIMGGLTDAEKTVTKYYAAYSFSLQQIHVEDFVHYDTND